MFSRATRCMWLALGLLMAVGTVARADWNPGDPYKMHYPQLPDLTRTGMDVMASQIPGTNNFKILADDWLCTETGPVGAIHIWGSWLNDYLPNGDAGNVAFKLSIHADIPATGGEPSLPGAELWSAYFLPGTFQTRLYATADEQFYDPNQDRIIGADTQVYQYNFTHIANPFYQQEGTIYWLDVQALPANPNALFGWKTTNPAITPHFNDDAVFADTIGFGGILSKPWTPMVYPAGHPYAGQSIDLAFVISVPEPASVALLGVGLGLAGLRFRRTSRRQIV